MEHAFRRLASQIGLARRMKRRTCRDWRAADKSRARVGKGPDAKTSRERRLHNERKKREMKSAHSRRLFFSLQLARFALPLPRHAAAARLKIDTHIVGTAVAPLQKLFFQVFNTRSRGTSPALAPEKTSLPSLPSPARPCRRRPLRHPRRALATQARWSSSGLPSAPYP